MNFGLTFLRTDAKNVHIIFRKPQTRSPISAWTLFHTSRKWVETMFRTWYSASQIYTTIVIIFASSGMDLYFVPRWLEKAGKISRTDWAGVGILVVWYPKGWNHEVSAGWLGNRKRPSFRNHLLERCLVEIWLWTMGIRWGHDPALPALLRSDDLCAERPADLNGPKVDMFTTLGPILPHKNAHERIEGNEGVENVANSWGILSITGRHFGKKSSNHIPRIWWWWCVIRCSEGNIHV